MRCLGGRRPGGNRRFAERAGRKRRCTMRKLLFALTTAAAVVAAGAFTTGRAEAMTVGTASGLQAALADVALLEESARVCRHRFYTSGRRCWLRPGYYRHYGFYRGPRWRHRHWGYRRW